MEYLTFNEYQELGGDLPESTFNILYRQAKAEIDKHTFNRLEDVTEISNNVKYAMFDLIDYLDSNKNIVSESANGYSVSYKFNDNDIVNIIERYLINEEVNGIPLLYRGV